MPLFLPRICLASHHTPPLLPNTLQPTRDTLLDPQCQDLAAGGQRHVPNALPSTCRGTASTLIS
jgi:hypothetical protein